MIEMQRVNSSNVHAVGYNPATKTLHVQFGQSADRRMPGKTYAFPGVPPEKHEGLITARSVGGYFAEHIKPHYNGRVVSSP